MTDHGSALIRATALTKIYQSGPQPVTALSDVDLSVEPGTVAVIKGRSGSGKTTMLTILGGLDTPTSGTIHFDGAPLAELTDNQRCLVRRTEMGFIVQSFGLLPILTAAENVEVPLRLTRTDPAERYERARDLLEAVGLGPRAQHRPHELSGGEQQRVAIARAIANRPRLLLADEPTGQLDSRTGGEVFDLLLSLVHNEGIAAVVATHDSERIAAADQVLELSDGRLKIDSSV